MARRTRFTAYDEPVVEEFDDDDARARVSEFLSYQSAPLPARRIGASSEDDMPIFLSTPDELDRPRFGRGRASAISSRLLKLSILAACVAAVVAGIMSMENPLAVFANAKASLIGTSAGQSAAIQSATAQMKAAPEPVVAVRSASAEQAAPETQPTSRALPPTAKSAPARDDIAAAFRTARQGQPAEVVQPTAPPPVAAAPAARRLDPDELAALLKRAKSLIAIGDIAPARLLLERAADAQEPSAALLLAQTYDPAVLGTQDMRSITPDPAKARDWYQKAARFGSQDAQQRLSQMQN